MKVKNKLNICFVLASFTLILSIISIFTPWWRISTTKEMEITNGIFIGAEYGLLQAVSASKISKPENVSISMTISLTDLPEEKTAKGRLQTLFLTSLALTTSGCIFTALTTIMLYASNSSKTLRPYIKIATILGAIVFLVAPMNFLYQINPMVAKLNSVIPEEIYSLPGTQITAPWGNAESYQGLSWMWGPAAGWFLTFTVFLLNVSAYILIRFTEERAKAYMV